MPILAYWEAKTSPAGRQRIYLPKLIASRQRLSSYMLAARQYERT